MKKVVLFGIILLSITRGFSQVDDSSKYTWYKYQYGSRMDRYMPDKMLYIPYVKDTLEKGARPGAFIKLKTDGQIYQWENGKWNLFGGVDNSKVPLSRTITINGITQNLAADRTWTITKADVGLGNVDNTSDLNKPVSTAQQAALDDTALAIRSAIVGTNLSNTPAPSTVQVSSSTGTPTTLPAATFTNAGVFTARDKQMLDSAYQATKAGFGGDTSIVVYAGILRPSWGAIGSTDTLRWSILGIGDNHDTLGPLRVTATPVNGAVYVKYPHVARVISAIAVTDETLSGKGVWMGCSSGTDSTMITLYVNTMGNSLSTATGNGTGWNNANYVWAAGITTISMTGTIGSYDGYVSNVEYIGSNNYYIKYVTTAISAGTVKIQLWDRITNTQVTTAPTASDILLNKRPMFPTPVSNYYIGSTGIPNAVYGIAGPNGISAGNIWFFFIGKRSI